MQPQDITSDIAKRFGVPSNTVRFHGLNEEGLPSFSIPGPDRFEWKDILGSLEPTFSHTIILTFELPSYLCKSMEQEEKELEAELRAELDRDPPDFARVAQIASLLAKKRELRRQFCRPIERIISVSLRPA